MIFRGVARKPGRGTHKTRTSALPAFGDLGFEVNYPLPPSATRDYNPTLGRWLVPDPAGQMAVDPANPQTWNMYAYVGDNPTTLNDPSGLDWVTAGNCSYDQEPTTVVGSKINGVSYPSTTVPGYIAATVGQCSGIADGDLPAPPVVPDTTIQYRISNEMIVAAQFMKQPQRPPVPSGNFGDYTGCAVGATINQFFGNDHKVTQTVGYLVGTAGLAATGNPLVYPVGALALIYYTNGFLKVRAKCEKETGYIP